MDDVDQDQLTPAEARALAALAAGGEPPAGLEERTVARLKERGLVAGRRRSARNFLFAAAAAVAVFAAGVLAGRHGASGPPSEPGMPRYALFLYDAPDEKGLTEAQMQARVDEYRSWAGQLARQGHDIQGEKLEDASRHLGATAPVAAGPVLGGYFVITAKDYAGALDVARTCPHLKHGGAIEVRAIAKT
jgi:hypothetical protein